VSGRGRAILAVLCALPALTGCGGVYYAVEVNAAQARVEQARQLGAEHAAPYEYYYATEHLRQARLEASEASYGDAAGYAETAETYAQKAIDIITASQGSGPARAPGSAASPGGASHGEAPR
jgi:hypothetical protein